MLYVCWTVLHLCFPIVIFVQNEMVVGNRGANRRKANVFFFAIEFAINHVQEIWLTFKVCVVVAYVLCLLPSRLCSSLGPHSIQPPVYSASRIDNIEISWKCCAHKTGINSGKQFPQPSEVHTFPSSSVFFSSCSCGKLFSIRVDDYLPRMCMDWCVVCVRCVTHRHTLYCLYV